MLLSDLAKLKFDINDYEDNAQKKAFLTKFGSKDLILNTDYLSDEDFALVITEKNAKLRKFPLCNIKTAIMSKLFLEAGKNELPKTLVKMASKNINAFLNSRPILNNRISTQELYTAEKELEKQAAIIEREQLPDDDYALVINQNGSKIRLFPINDEINCKLASEYFSKNYKKMPIDMRHKFATSVVTKCASSGFDKNIITDDIRSYCNNILNDNFVLEIDARKDQIASKKIAKALDVLKDTAITGKVSLIKIASYLAQLDKETGLDKFYNKKFSDAYQAVFSRKSNFMNKEANVTPTQVDLVGEYEIASQVPYNSQMQELFSKEDFEAALSSPEAFAALPAPYKQAILQQAMAM